MEGILILIECLCLRIFGTILILVLVFQHLLVLDKVLQIAHEWGVLLVDFRFFNICSNLWSSLWCLMLYGRTQLSVTSCLIVQKSRTCTRSTNRIRVRILACLFLNTSNLSLRLDFKLRFFGLLHVLIYHLAYLLLICSRRSSRAHKTTAPISHACYPSNQLSSIRLHCQRILHAVLLLACLTVKRRRFWPIFKTF